MSTDGIKWVEVKNYAAQRRAFQADRDALIAELGWKKEDPKDRYLASAANLTTYVNEARVKAGKPEAQHTVYFVRPV